LEDGCEEWCKPGLAQETAASGACREESHRGWMDVRGCDVARLDKGGLGDFIVSAEAGSWLRLRHKISAGDVRFTWYPAGLRRGGPQVCSVDATLLCNSDLPVSPDDHGWAMGLWDMSEDV
jgi:hypothetical protein